LWHSISAAIGAPSRDTWPPKARRSVRRVDDVRDDFLARYLEEGARTPAEVSALLDFSDPTALSRWHRARFGVHARTRLGPRISKLAMRR
jgi:hypothetical protein